MQYNLILTGFMGTGKTTIGEQVAERLGAPFVDTDKIIVERLGKPVPEIFKDYGEPFFRAIEASICAELGQPKGWVVSTGGGALIRWENLKNIAGLGNIVICLTATPDEILHRLNQDTRNRPLVDNQEDRKRAIVNLLESRKEHYNRIRIRLDTTGRSVDELVEEVIAIYTREVGLNSIRLPVWSPDNRYTIVCSRGILDDVAYWLDAYNLRGKIILATNETLAPLYADKLLQQLPNASLVTMPDGEHYKTLATVQQLYADFAAAGLDRGGIVLAFGGGVVGDTVGYAAATYMRGVKLVQIPTTLLAMIDSSVGGKVGVDIPEGKNMVGAFKQPELVLMDTHVLKTLPAVELQCGLAEGIKHALIGDLGLLEHIEAMQQGDPAVIRRAVQVKIGVVERDPYEAGERAHLNLGHTFAHAVERVSGYTWRHGEAVGLGLVAAARLSQSLGYLSAAEVASVTELVMSAGLPTTCTYDPQALWQAMHTDKKWRAGHNHFVVLNGLGQALSVKDVPQATVLAILESLQESQDGNSHFARPKLELAGQP
jgi:3-dehydroquinate synthase